ncbi:hypothetical protein [Mycoplasma crocodyli]|uniref:Transmembrane protein n=1 Tax=Mycoplasma crocodyli (strain ATCC 51981 / MP145) TaxID=512564 RepID=D5E4M2_MYCCM|nr:hypothetical protein [Mycoplasma crocodyli]ADE19750.1 conserved hypothetical protein [Mycoplasma crocodyli MP145]
MEKTLKSMKSKTIFMLVLYPLTLILSIVFLAVMVPMIASGSASGSIATILIFGLVIFALGITSLIFIIQLIIFSHKEQLPTIFVLLLIGFFIPLVQFIGFIMLLVELNKKLK